jgi:hypothetical protein
MHSRAVATLGLPAGIVIGCVLAVWPLVSASAQTAGSDIRTNATPSSDSQPNARTSRDRWDESKASGTATDASRGTEIVSNAGEQISRSTAAVEAREFVQQYIAEKLTAWQQRLKLSEWQISWAMAHRSDLKPNTVGQIHWDKPSKSAAILVLDPSDYRMPGNAMLDDMELTIIHELVHLKLTSLPHSEASRGSEEQAVNGISEALFQLDHKKR